MPVVLMNSSSKTTVSAAASTSLKNFQRLADKLADQGTPNQGMFAPANGSCAIRTAISLINLCSAIGMYSSCRILETSEMFEHIQCVSIDCTGLALSTSILSLH